MAKSINYSIKVGVIGDAQLQKFQRTVEQINRSSEKTSRSVQKMGNQMSKLGSIAKVASAAMAIFYSAKGLTNVIAQADAMRNLEASFSTLLGSGERASAMMDEVFRIARRTGAPINDVAEATQRLAVGMGEMGASNAQINTVAETFIKLGRVGGASMADVNGALVQFSQGLSSGRLQGDEFRSISERLPLVMRALATELNVTVGELKQLGTDGKITADVMANAMINAAKDVDGQFAKLPLTFEQASNNFKTMLVQFSRSSVVVNTLDLLARALGSITTNVDAFIRDIGAMVSGMSEFEKKSVAMVAAIGAITIAIKALMLSNPFTAVAMAAVAAVALIITNWTKITDFFQFRIPIALNTLKAEWNYGMADILSATANVVESSLSLLDDLANGLLAPINVIREFTGMSRIAVDATTAGMQGLQDKIADFNKAGSDAMVVIQGLEAGLKASGEAAGGAVEELENFEITVNDAAEGAGRLARAAKDVKTEMEKAAESIKNSMGKALEDGIINAAKGGKDAFKNMAESILEDIARMVIQMKIIKPLMGSLFSGGGGGFLGGLFGSANGNYFPNGITGRPLTAFASGGVIGGRSVIGSNLIGENGPEAVVPLRRHGGQMGVAASPVNVNVINNSGSEVQVSESTGNDGSKTIDILIDSKVREAFSTGRMDKTMRANFGLKRVGA